MRESWEEVKLGEIAKVKGGKRLPKNHELISSKTDHKYIRARDIKGGKINFDNPSYITEDTFKHISRYIVNEDDLILTIVGANIGDVALVSKEFDKANLTENAVKIMSNKSKVVPKFLLYYLLPQYSKDYLQILASGAAQDKLGLYKINILNISLPPLETQRKISNILSSYDDLIENNQKRIKILEEMAQQTYEEWFVRMRFPGYETAVFDENGLPEGWEKVKIQDLCNVSGGGTPSKANDKFWVNGNINWFTPTDLSKNKSLVISDSELKTNELGILKSSAKILQPDSFIMTSRATIGLFALIDKPFSTNQGFINTTPNSSNLKAYLLYNFKYRVDELMGLATGATFPELSKSKFKVLNINKPSDTVLNYFKEFTENIFGQLFNLSNQNKSLREARDILLPRLMMGIIDIERLEEKPTNTTIIALEQPKKEPSKEFKEAVLIACLTERFGSENYPLGRKRYTKLSYLFHRYSDNKIQDYLRKAAGPYNPKTKYGGPEKIALTSKYIKDWKGEKGTTGFVFADKIDDAKKYFSNYWQIADLDWLVTEFKFKSNDELELLATVDNSLMELSKNKLEFTATNVLNIIKSEKEWEAKLERTIFSDANVEKAIGFLTETLQYEK